MSKKLTFAYRGDGHVSDETVVFSYIDGFVWLTWPGAVEVRRVGKYEAVMESMKDFLAQSELGERLAAGTSKSRLPSPLRL